MNWINIFKAMAKNHFPKCFCTQSNLKNSSTAGIIVIGDEILKGQVADTNSTFMAQELRKLGIQLKKISVIGDNVNEVSTEVKQFSNTYDYVLTTGGIGPTHDDITYEAVALAFDEPLHFHPELKEICSKFYNTTNEDYPGMKLANIPKSAALNYSTLQGLKMNYPNVSVKNVYMFPGIPELMKKSLVNLGPALFKSDRKFYATKVFVNMTEDKIAPVLDKLVKEFPEVQFGSYPKLYDSSYKVKITLESSSETATNQARDKLLTLIPQEFIVSFSEDK